MNLIHAFLAATATHGGVLDGVQLNPYFRTAVLCTTLETSGRPHSVAFPSSKNLDTLLVQQR
jgi:hypothetical protein